MAHVAHPVMARPYRTVLFAVAVVCAVALVARTGPVLFVLFAGALFAVALHGAASAAARWSRLPYGPWVAAIVILLLAAGVLGLTLLAPRLAEQIPELLRQLPTAVNALLEHVRRGPGGELLVAPGATFTPPRGLAAGALRTIGSSAEVLGGLVVTFFVGIYGAAKPSAYIDAILALTPHELRPRVRRAAGVVAHNLQRWLLGRLAAMAFVGVGSGLVFVALGVPLAFALAVLAGFLTFIEYAGAIISAIPPILLAFTQSATTALWVAVAFVGIHVVEGYVITPLVARASARLPPAFTLAGQVVFGALVGVLGLTFSTPLLVVAAAAIGSFRSERAGHEPDPHPTRA